MSDIDLLLDNELVDETINKIILSVDEVSRNIQYNGKLLLGVEQDYKAECIYFKLPKYIHMDDKIDLSSSSVSFYVKYINANNELYIHECTNIEVTDDSVIVGWLLSENVTKSSGNVQFKLCVKNTSVSDGVETISNEWHTNVFTGKVEKGIPVESTTPEIISDPTSTAYRVETMANEARVLADQADKRVKSVEEQITDINSETVVTKQQIEINASYDDQQMLVKRIGGRTLVKNQLIDKSKICKTQTVNGVTFTNNGDGSFVLNGTATANTYFPLISHQESLLINHKYTIVGLSSQATNYGKSLLMSVYTSSGSWKDEFAVYTDHFIVTFTKAGCEKIGLDAHVGIGHSYDNAYFKPQLIDLTLKYGAGNEPTTLTQILNDMNDYEEYDTGSFVHSKNDLVSIGRNIWDEKWFGGYYNNLGHEYRDGTEYISTENFIRVSPNTSYSSNKMRYWCMYDNDKNFISRLNGETITTSNNCYYVKCTTINTYGNIYKNDIIINVGVTALPYEPHQEDKVNISKELKDFDYIDNISNNQINASSPIITFNGSENWEFGTTYTATDSDTPTLQQYKLSYDISKLIDLASYRGEAICDRMQWTKETTFKDLKDYYLTINTSGTLIYALIPISSGITTVDAFKAWLAKNNVSFFYKLKNPTVEPITIPGGVSVWKNGMLIQEGTIPYELTKEYSLSLVSQMIANTKFNKSQQEQIYSIKAENENNKTLIAGNTDLIEKNMEDIDDLKNKGDQVDQKIQQLENQTISLTHNIYYLMSPKNGADHVTINLANVKYAKFIICGNGANNISQINVSVPSSTGVPANIGMSPSNALFIEYIPGYLFVSTNNEFYTTYSVKVDNPYITITLGEYTGDDVILPIWCKCEK